MVDDASSDPASPARLLALTARIVSAQVRGNEVGAAEPPRLVESVHRALDGLAREPAEAEPSRPEPAVPVRRSVRPDAIVCPECGARLKVLRRHLATDHGLTPPEPDPMPEVASPSDEEATLPPPAKRRGRRKTGAEPTPE